MPSLSSTFSSLLALGAIQGALALDAAGWRNQSIYQVVTDRFARTDGTAPACDSAVGRYCGGSWKGITNHLDYIQNLGATAVWISPIIKNVEGYFNLSGEAYHGFWAENLYEVNDHFGTADDLRELASALHARGMYLMVDIAPNHVGLNKNPGNYSAYTPFNDESYYHKKCNIRWNNPTSERLCRLADLPDLRTEDDRVRKIYASWIKDLVANYSIDGIRVDTAMEIEPEFWTDGGVKAAAGVFLLAEINHSKPDDLAPYQTGGYLDGYMDYSSWNYYTKAFQKVNADFATLYNGTNYIAGMAAVDPSVWGSFVENQDQVRFPNRNQDMSLAKNIHTCAMLRDGIPIVYYGQEQHYAGGATPFNREALWLGVGYSETSELYTWIQRVNKIRRTAAEFDAAFLTSRTTSLFYDDNSPARVIAFKKSQLVTMYTNGGVAAVNNVTYAIEKAATGYAPNQQLVDVLNCESFYVDHNGRLHVMMPNGGLPRAFLPKEQAAGICSTVAAPASQYASKQTIRIM